ncbi:hypothetical protein BGZ49_003901, partial [Haplosporangium sp. Z 27]
MLLYLIPLFIIESLPLILATIVYEIRIIYFLLFGRKDRPISPRYSFDCIAFLPWKPPKETKTWQGKFVASSCGIVWLLSEFTLDLILIVTGRSIEDVSRTQGIVGSKEDDNYLTKQLQQQQEEFMQARSEYMDDAVEALIVEDAEDIYEDENAVPKTLATIEEEEDEEDLNELIKDGLVADKVADDVLVEMGTAIEEFGVEESLSMNDTMEDSFAETIVPIIEEKIEDDSETKRQDKAARYDGIRNSDYSSKLTFEIDQEAVLHSNTELASEREKDETNHEKGIEESQYLLQDQSKPDVPQVDLIIAAIQSVNRQVISSADTSSDSSDTSDNDSTDTDLESEGCVENCGCQTDRMLTCPEDKSLTRTEAPVLDESSSSDNTFKSWSERKVFSSNSEPVVQDIITFAALLRQGWPHHYTGPVISPKMAARICLEAVWAKNEYFGYTGDNGDNGDILSVSSIAELDDMNANSTENVTTDDTSVATDAIDTATTAETSTTISATDATATVETSSSTDTTDIVITAEASDDTDTTGDAITAEASDDTDTAAPISTSQKKKKKKNKNKNKNKNKKSQSQEQNNDTVEGHDIDMTVHTAVASSEASKTLKMMMESAESAIAACTLDGKFTELESVKAMTKENRDIRDFYLDAQAFSSWERKPSREA